MARIQVIFYIMYSDVHRMAEAVAEGSPYGAGTLAGADGLRQPSEIELAIACYQGRHVAQITDALVRGRQAAE